MVASAAKIQKPAYQFEPVARSEKERRLLTSSKHQSASEINTQRSKLVYECSRQAQQTFVAANNPSTSAILFNIRPPQAVLVDRTIEVDLKLQLVFTGTSGSGNLINVNSLIGTSAWTDAVRFLPFSQICTSATANINNTQVSFIPYQCNGLYRCISDSDLNSYFSMTGGMPDQFQSYGDATSLGQNRNPFAAYGENPYFQTRGSLFYTATGLSGTAATIIVEISEPIMLPPFLYGHQGQMKPALANIQTLDLNFVLGNLQRFWSHDNSAGAVGGPHVITNIVANVVSANALVTFITPYDDNRVDLQKAYIYQNFNVVPYLSTSTATLAGGSAATLALGSQSYGSIPSKLYIWAEDTNSTKSVNTSDSFAYIQSLSITWDNRTGLLASATPMQLYKMSVANGLNMSFAQWQSFCGSVIVVDVAKDLGLDNLECPGMLKQIQFLLQATISNPANYPSGLINATRTYNLVVVPVFPGYIAIRNGSAESVVGDLTANDVIIAKTSPDIRYARYNHQQMFSGGGIFGDLWSGIKDIYQGVKKYGRPVVDAFGKALDSVAPLAQLNPALASAYGVARGIHSGADQGLRLAGLSRKMGGMSVGGMPIGGMIAGGRRHPRQHRRHIRGGCSDCVGSETQSIMERRLNRQ